MLCCGVGERESIDTFFKITIGGLHRCHVGGQNKRKINLFTKFA